MGRYTGGLEKKAIPAARWRRQLRIDCGDWGILSAVEIGLRGAKK